MKISEVINKMKAYHKGTVNGQPIDEAKTRDKILFGNPDQECTGIVTSCWASADVIRQAKAMNANLIIVHEALFWNHGDHTDWLEEQQNPTYLAKKQLLEEGGIVVWRDHDYIHSGIPMPDGSYTDGIFYGLMKILGWESYLACDPSRPMLFEVPETSAEKIGRELIEQLHLNGIKVVGDLQAPVRRIAISMHILGEGDREKITMIDEQKIDLLISLELIDFTVSEYIRDSAMLNLPKAILAVGHFNVEEPGMEYMIRYIPEALGTDAIPCRFVPSSDMYEFLI